MLSLVAGYPDGLIVVCSAQGSTESLLSLRALAFLEEAPGS